MSPHSKREWIARVAVVILSLLSTSIASAQASEREPAPDEEPAGSDRSAASTHFRRGVQLHAEGDYEAAIIEFQRAYEASPDHRVLYNLGVTHLAQRSYVESLDAFVRYLELGGAEVPPERRAQVEQHIASLRSRIGLLAIRVDVEGAEVAIDDEIVGRAPLEEPVPVDVGRHVVAVRAPGYVQERRTVSVAGGDELTVELSLSPLPTTVVVAPEPSTAGASAREPRGRGLRTAALVGVVGTAALAAGAGTTGGLALRSQRELEAARTTFPGDPEAIDSAERRTRTFGIVTDALAGTAIALGGTSLALFLVDRSRADERERAGRRVELEVAFEPLGATLRGRFGGSGGHP